MMAGYKLVETSILVSLTVSLSLLVYVSHSRAQESANAVNVESFCGRQGNLALELTLGAKIALGSKMIFAPDSLQDVATISAYPLDAPDSTSNSWIPSSDDYPDSTFYAIVEEYDDDISWWELPTYQAYEISASDASSILSHFDENMEEDNSDENRETACSIAFLGYGGESRLADNVWARMSEFVLIGDPQVQVPSRMGR